MSSARDICNRYETMKPPHFHRQQHNRSDISELNFLETGLLNFDLFIKVKNKYILSHPNILECNIYEVFSLYLLVYVCVAYPWG